MSNNVEQTIIDRARHPHFAGETTEATHKASGANASCGDDVYFELRVVDNTIAEINHQCRACTICIASADMLAEYLKGKSVESITSTTNEQVLAMINLPLSPIRQKCALLPLYTLQQLEPVE